MSSKVFAVGDYVRVLVSSAPKLGRIVSISGPPPLPDNDFVIGHWSPEPSFTVRLFPSEHEWLVIGERSLLLTFDSEIPDRSRSLTCTKIAPERASAIMDALSRAVRDGHVKEIVRFAYTGDSLYAELVYTEMHNG